MKELDVLLIMASDGTPPRAKERENRAPRWRLGPTKRNAPVIYEGNMESVCRWGPHSTVLIFRKLPVFGSQWFGSVRWQIYGNYYDFLTRGTGVVGIPFSSFGPVITDFSVFLLFFILPNLTHKILLLANPCCSFLTNIKFKILEITLFIFLCDLKITII